MTAVRSWNIYGITEVATGRLYVGVTARTVAARLLAHWYRSGRADARFRPGSLAEAMRRARAAGKALGDAFRTERIDVAGSEEAAAIVERDWIENLGTAVPRGFNIMPGGASLGGPSNSRPIVLQFPGEGPRSFPSVGEAHAWCRDRVCGTRAWDGAGPPPPRVPPPSIHAVRERLARGWPPEEAFGLQPHRDRRGLRGTPLHFGGRRITALRDAAGPRAVATLRSRAHRARLAGMREDDDLASDRRRRGAWRASRRAVGLPHPARSGGPRKLGARSFADAAGVPAATVVHRLRRMERRGSLAEAVPGPELVRLLSGGPADRRRVIEAVLMDGSRLRGGHRELARRITSDTRLAAWRTEALSESGIRRRLRRLSAAPSNDEVLRALGMACLAAGCVPPQHVVANGMEARP